MRTNLLTDPKIDLLLQQLKERQVTIYGALFRLWAIAEEHGKFDDPDEEGHSDAYLEMTTEMIDASVQIPGFCAAMVKVNWMRMEDEQVIIPRFTKHMGRLARRINERQRKRQRRQKEDSPAEEPKTGPRPKINHAVVAMLQRLGLGRNNAVALARDPEITPQMCLIAWSRQRGQPGVKNRPGLIYKLLAGDEISGDERLSVTDVIEAQKQRLLATIGGHDARTLEWHEDGQRSGFRRTTDRKIVVAWDNTNPPEVT